MADVPELTLVKEFAPFEEIPLELHVMMTKKANGKPDHGRPPVLLLHGASAQHETFCIPKSGDSLASTLYQKGYEPWLLDWRGSRRVTDAMNVKGSLTTMRDVLDLDHAAKEDIPRAVKQILASRKRDPDAPELRVNIVAHCLGAAVLSQAIAGRHVLPNEVGEVVLLTIGLFYEPPLDGKLKAQFHVLERMWREKAVSLIDPRRPDEGATWPRELGSLYEGVGLGLRPHPHADEEPRCSHALCNRISFMFGTPFRHANLVYEIHGRSKIRFMNGRIRPRRGERIHAVRRQEAGKPSLDRDQPERPSIGFVHEVTLESGSWRVGNASGVLELTGSVGKFRGRARVGEGATTQYELRTRDTKFADWDGKPRGEETAELSVQFGGMPLRMYLQGTRNIRRGWAGGFAAKGPPQDDRQYIDDTALARFRQFKSVTLITGAKNQLWHRASIDLMHEWLTKGLRPSDRGRFRKKVFADYGHQDLLWGRQSREVFRFIIDVGLGGEGKGEIVGPPMDDPAHLVSASS